MRVSGATCFFRWMFSIDRVFTAGFKPAVKAPYRPVPTREAAHTTRQTKTLEQRTLTTKNLKRLQKMANIL